MKTISQIIKTGSLYFFIVLVIQGCTKFIEDSELKRKNVYDKQRYIENDYAISLETVEIVKEDSVEDGLIEKGETVWYKIIIKNDGPEPAYVREFDLEQPEGSLFIVNNSLSFSNFTYSLEGKYVVEDFLEPGESYAFVSNETTDEGEKYTYSLRRTFNNVGDNPSMNVMITTGIKTEEIINNVINVPVDYQ